MIATSRATGAPHSSGTIVPLQRTRCSARFGRIAHVAAGEVRRAPRALGLFLLDGASLPEEPRCAAELGYEALALTDHDGVFGSLEFALQRRRSACGRSPGRRSRSRAALTSRCSSRMRGYANLCRLLTAAHGRGPSPRIRRSIRAVGPAPARAERRARLSFRAARGTLAVRDPNTAAAGRRRRRPLRRAPAAVRAGCGTPRCESSRICSACRRSRPATCTRTMLAAHSCRTCSSRSASARRSTARRPSVAVTTSRFCSRPARCSSASPTTATRSSARGRARRAPALRSHSRPRLQLSRLRRRRAGEQQAQARLRPRVRGELLRAERPQAQCSRQTRRGSR